MKPKELPNIPNGDFCRSWHGCKIFPTDTPDVTESGLLQSPPNSLVASTKPFTYMETPDGVAGNPRQVFTVDEVIMLNDFMKNF